MSQNISSPTAIPRDNDGKLPKNDMPISRKSRGNRRRNRRRKRSATIYNRQHKRIKCEIDSSRVSTATITSTSSSNPSTEMAVDLWRRTYESSILWQCNRKITFYQNRIRILEQENNRLMRLMGNQSKDSSRKNPSDMDSSSSSSTTSTEEEEAAANDSEIEQKFFDFLEKSARHREAVNQRKQIDHDEEEVTEDKSNSDTDKVEIQS